MPVSTWLGWSDAPGDVAGHGPVDAGTCRDLARRLAAGPATSWCLTLTDPAGRAVAHGCANDGCPSTGPRSTRAGPGGTRAGPGGTRPGDRPRATGPPTGPPVRAGQAWIASVQLHWLERDRCGHPRRVSSYRTGRVLRHLIIIRHRTCGFPGCSRPATRCDADHTVPFDQGGITCECNISPLCRQHHKTKQTYGWSLTQPEPGILVWTTPHGRSYTTTPDLYP